MERHPVPQNITSFQFKLVGDMTLRQFGYLAAGIILGYLVLQLDWFNLIKWSLAAVVAGAGFAFAFLPIEERPLDRWLVSFLKRIYLPTQFLWKKRSIPPEILTVPLIISPPPTPETLKKEKTAVRMEEYLQSLPRLAQTTNLDKQESSFVNQLGTYYSSAKTISAPTPQPLPQPKPVIVPPVINTTPKPVPPQNIPPAADFDQKTEKLTTKITDLQQELKDEKITKEEFVEIQTQLAQLLKEKDTLTSELLELKKAYAKNTVDTAIKPTVMSQAPEPTVKIVPANITSQLGMLKPPTTANIISGIVKTQKGMLLPGI